MWNICSLPQTEVRWWGFLTDRWRWPACDPCGQRLCRSADDRQTLRPEMQRRPEALAKLCSIILFIGKPLWSRYIFIYCGSAYFEHTRPHSDSMLLALDVSNMSFMPIGQSSAHLVSISKALLLFLTGDCFMSETRDPHEDHYHWL